MSNSPYTARYSPNGHSVQRLKNEAKKLASKTQPKIKHRDALNHMANSVGYSSWDELVANPDPARDLFFANIYSTRGHFSSSPLYKDFLTKQRLNDNPESFRQYAVDLLLGYKEMDFHRLARPPSTLTGEILLPKLNQYYTQHGAIGLLPQKLPENLLHGLVDEFVNFKFVFENDPENVGSASIAANLFVVAAIKIYKNSLNGSISGSVEIDEDEIFELIETYHVAAYLEEMSRSTKVKVNPVTMDDIFSQQRKIYFQWPE